jgi:hypothetical protein
VSRYRLADDPEPVALRVMPANSTGWYWHTLARETGRLGHLYSPDAQRGPWPWLPYALDNGAFSAWDQDANTWDAEKWSEAAWRRLLLWSTCASQPALWAIVPDVPGQADATIERWRAFAPVVRSLGIPCALAVQNGMTPESVRDLRPDVVCVGGTTDWKWATVAEWAAAFPRVHLLRCNSPTLVELAALGVESCDGTGWSRGDRRQTQGLEEWCRAHARPADRSPLWPHVCRASRMPAQLGFA